MDITWNPKTPAGPRPPAHPHEYFVVGDIVATVKDCQFGVVINAKEGWAEAIRWYVSQAPSEKRIHVWDNSEIRQATEPEKVMLRLTGKI